MSSEIVLSDSDSMNPLTVRSIISDMVQESESLVVNSEQSYKKITSLYSQAREFKKYIEARRKSVTEPIRKQLSAINDKAKELTDPLDRVIYFSNAKANGYIQLLEQMRINQQEKLRQAADLFEASDQVYLPEVENVVRGEGASAVTKKEKNFRLVDLSKVPLKYLMLDEDQIKKDLKMGIDEIPGLEIYEETKTTLRVR